MIPLALWGSSDPSDIIGKQATVFARSEDEGLHIMHTVLEKGHWSGEIVGRRKDGSPITVHLSASLVRNEKGDPTNLMCSFIDISERKRIEEDHRIKESAIASSINGIAICDLAGYVTYINNATLSMWGSSDPTDIIGKHIVVFAQSEEEGFRIMKTVLEEGQWSGEIVGRRMDGSPVTVHLSASLLKNAEGVHTNLMCSFVDVTDRKRIETN
jgi:PAS domain S-box-containing protein